jgi:hypothetical protein
MVEISRPTSYDRKRFFSRAVFAPRAHLWHWLMRFQIPDSQFQMMMVPESEIWNLESEIWNSSLVAASAALGQSSRFRGTRRRGRSEPVSENVRLLQVGDCQGKNRVILADLLAIGPSRRRSQSVKFPIQTWVRLNGPGLVFSGPGNDSSAAAIGLVKLSRTRNNAGSTTPRCSSRARLLPAIAANSPHRTLGTSKP